MSKEPLELDARLYGALGAIVRNLDFIASALISKPLESFKQDNERKGLYIIKRLLRRFCRESVGDQEEKQSQVKKLS